MNLSNLQINAQTASGLTEEEIVLLNAVVKMAIGRNIGTQKGTFAFFCQQSGQTEQCVSGFDLAKGESLAYTYRPRHSRRIKVMSHEAVFEDAIGIFYADGYPRENAELKNCIQNAYPASLITLEASGGSFEAALFTTNGDQEAGNIALVLIAFARALFYLRDDAKLRESYVEAEKKARWEYRHSSPDSICIDDIERMVDVVDALFRECNIPELIAWNEWRAGSGETIASKSFFA